MTKGEQSIKTAVQVQVKCLGSLESNLQWGLTADDMKNI